MSSEPNLIEDYSTSQVPESQTINGWRVAAIIIGINVGLATFLNGAQVGSALGLKDALLCAFFAGVILCIMGSLTAIASVRSRLTTYVLVQCSFGRKGAVVVNIILAIIHLGWFGVNASFFGSAMVAAIEGLYQTTGPFGVIVMVGSLLMAITTIFGFKAINKLALWAIPIWLGVPALVILIFSTWTANSVNLYSSSLSMSATIMSVKPWVFTILGGILGGIVAVVGIVESFVPFLLILGVIIPPHCGDLCD